MLLIADSIWGSGDPEGFGRVIFAVLIAAAALVGILGLILKEGEDEHDLDEKIRRLFFNGLTKLGLAESLPAAGWYPDPWRQAAQRWWDGNRWTEHTA